MILRCFSALAAAAALAPAAHAGGYPDCEKFDEPLAYNQCLASHGPSANHALAAAVGDTVVTATGGAPAPAVHSLHRTAHGRMTATFVIEDAHRSPAHHKFSRAR